MALKHTSFFALLFSSALLLACESSEDPALVDSGAPIIPGGSLSGATGGTTPGGTTGTPSGGTPGGMQTTLGGVQPGGAPGTAIPGGVAGMGSTGLGGLAAGGMPAGTGDAGAPGGAGDGGSAASSDGGAAPPLTGGTCPGLPAVTDYAVKGPFGDVMMKPDVIAGSEGCTLFRPGASLGKDGYKHPIAVWGNGILTDPPSYQKLLGHIVSHGFVVVACNSSMPELPCLTQCMDWLVKQNDSGDMAGKLDTSKEIAIGYSWGGGAAVDTSTRPNIKATISFHGMPPRNDPWAKMKAPLLLFTSTGDTFVSAEQYVTPNYNSSKVTTFYASLQENVGHVYPCDEGSLCDSVGGLALGGPSMGAIKEQAPAVAWLRYWVCGDQNAKKYFFGSDCLLCNKSPWKAQSKPMGAFN